MPAAGSASTGVEVVRLNKEVISLYRQGNSEEALIRGIETCELARCSLGETDLSTITISPMSAPGGRSCVAARVRPREAPPL